MPNNFNLSEIDAALHAHNSSIFSSEPSSQFSSLRSSRDVSPYRKNTTIAFAFDIDGVLVRSAKPIPGAREAISKLQQEDIPFIFLTNGGGKTEKDHVALVGKRLDLQLSEDQFVQSHTPFKDLVPTLKDENILVLGGTGNSIRLVAQAYGFKNVFTPSDIYKAYPDIYPFAELTAEQHCSNGSSSLPLNADGLLKISAVLVWSSPRDWGMDLQLLVDLMLSRQGYLNTVSPLNGISDLPNNGYGQDSQPTIHWCNPDLTWATKHPLPRVAQGSFRAALQGIWKAQTGLDAIPHEQMVGKPTDATYVYGERVLTKYNQKLNGFMSPSISTVYMIGDNPASDIQGANAFRSPRGYQWKSILVESGIHKAGDTPAFVPTHTVPNVLDAVNLAISENEAFNGSANTSQGGTEISTPALEEC